MEKLTRLNAPYISNELNRARQALSGSMIGRVLSGLDLTHVPPLLRATNNGNISIDPSSRLRKFTDTGAIFLTTASVDDWLIVGSIGRDRVVRHRGATSVGLTNLDDASGPFTSQDVNKIVVIYSGNARGIYYISSFLSASSVQLSSPTGFVTESNLQYGILEPRENFGVYRIVEVIDDNNLYVDAVKPFITDQVVTDNLLYSVFTPAKLKIDPGTFMSAGGVIVNVLTQQEITYPTTWFLPETPKLVLHAQTLDEREDSPITFQISSGQYDVPNSTIIAVSDLKYSGQNTSWFKVAGHGSETIRRDVDKLISGFGQPGWHLKPFEIRINDIPWPPRLEVRYPKRDDGGFEKNPKIGTADSVGLSEISVLTPDRHGELILDSPLYPPVIGRERIDTVCVTKRSHRELDKDIAQGSGMIQDGIGDLFLNHRIGVTESYGGRNDDEFPLSRGGFHVSNTLVSDSSSCKVISNYLGVSIFAYVDKNLTPDSVTVRSLHPENHGELSTPSIVITATNNAFAIDLDVDVNGFFHVVWLENFEVFYAKIDPTGTFVVHPRTKVSTTTSANIPKICVSLTQVVNVFWFDAGTSEIQGAQLVSDGMGTATILTPQKLIVGGVFNVFDAEITLDSDRIYVVGQEAGTHKVYTLVDDLNVIETYNIPNVSNMGPVFSFYNKLALKRNNRDEIVLACSGLVTNRHTRHTLLATRLLPSGFSKLDGYVVCDSSQSETVDFDYIVWSLTATDDGGWIVATSNTVLPGDGKASLVKLSASLQAVHINRDLTTYDGSECDVSFVPIYGDVFYTFIIPSSSEAKYSIVDADMYDLPVETINGFSTGRYNDLEEYVLAEIHVSAGSMPLRPGVGMYLFGDATPLSSTLDVGTADAESLVDGIVSAGLPADIGTSFGVSLTHTDSNVNCMLLIDAIESDGFDPAIDIDNNIKVYISNDNLAWTELTLYEIYRIKGRTYLIFEDSIARYYKVNFEEQIYVPRPNGNPYFLTSNAMRIIEVRLIAGIAFVHGHDYTNIDGKRIRSIDIRFKNLPELPDIYVGDGITSFGEFLGADGLAKAFRESIANSVNVNDGYSYPRGNRKVHVGRGVYRLREPLYMPGGLNVEFEPGALIVDYLKTINQRTIYNYSANPPSAIKGFAKSRTIHLRENVNHLGITPGSKVYLQHTFPGPIVGSHLFTVIGVGNSGYTLHLDKIVGLISNNPGDMDICKVYKPGLRINGLNLQIESANVLMSGNQIDLRYIDGLVIENTRIEDTTEDDTTDYNCLNIEECRDIFLDNLKIFSVSSENAISISNCEGVKGGVVEAKTESGSCIDMYNCSDVGGFSNLITDGPSANLSLKLEEFYGVLGRMKTRDAASIVTTPPNTIEYDEFFNVYIHNDFIAALINGGAYEMMLSTVMGWVQSFHSIPWTSVPSGWVDGIVNDFIVDALAST